MSDVYGQPDPYGQPPTGQPSPYGQQPSYGAPRSTVDRRPGTVTAAAWIAMVFSAIAALLFGLTGLALLVARDQVITEMERVPEFQDANINADAAVGVLVAVMLGIVVWSVITIVLGVMVLRRSSVARILLVISSVVAALLSLLTITSGVSAVTLIAAVATVVMLFVGGAGDWFKGVGSSSGGYPGAPAGYPDAQYGDPYAGQYGAQPTQPTQPTQPQPPAQDAPVQYPSSDNPYGQPPESQDPYGQRPPGADNPYGQPPQDR